MSETLRGRRILILRPDGPRAERLADLVRERHGEPVVVPAIAFDPPEDRSRIDAALTEGFDWLVFTSVTGVEIAFPEPAAQPFTGRLAAVGPATAREIGRRTGLSAWTPTDHSNDGLAAELPGPARVALFRAAIADDDLEHRLRARGFDVTRIDTYHTRHVNRDRIRAALDEGIDAVAVTSASIARALSDVADPAHPLPPLCCIGAPSAEECRRHGMHPAAVAPDQTPDALVEALELCLVGGED